MKAISSADLDRSSLQDDRGGVDELDRREFGLDVLEHGPGHDALGGAHQTAEPDNADPRTLAEPEVLKPRDDAFRPKSAIGAQVVHPVLRAGPPADIARGLHDGRNFVVERKDHRDLGREPADWDQVARVGLKLFEPALVGKANQAVQILFGHTLANQAPPPLPLRQAECRY